MADVTIGLAFLAGFISFISPCVLPLVPAYIGYMGGRATNEANKTQRNRFGTALHGVFFVLGFTLFFVSFGLLTAAASSFLASIGINIPTVLTRLGGLAIIFFGLYTMRTLDPVFARLQKTAQGWNNSTPQAWAFTLALGGGLLGYFYWAFGANMPTSLIWAVILLLGILGLFRTPLNTAQHIGDFWVKAISQLQLALATDTRQLDFQPNKKDSYFSSLAMGLVFSAGWTPCIGPVFAAVLTLANESAAQGESLVQPALMLTAYSLGLGIPFLLTAVAFNQSVSLMNKLKRHMRKVEVGSGAFLLVIGVLLLTGNLTRISAQLSTQGAAADFSYRLEACTVGIAEGVLQISNYPTCLGDGYEKVIKPERAILAVNKTGETANVRYTFPAIDEAAVVEGLQVGNRAPDFSLELLDGSTVQLADLRGQVVLVNFWATWCAPCRQEMPEFQRLYALQADMGFVVLAVDFQDPRDSVQAFADEYDLSFPIALDFDGDVNAQYKVASYPTSYLIDGNGIIVLKKAGPLSVQELLEALDQFETVPIDEVTAYQAD